ncbi:MAG: hypothetical protein ACSHWZ_13985 [Sulfitobacter sp.]
MLGQIKHQASAAARRAGIAFGGLLCVVVGLGFFSSAAWIYLALEFDALIASMILGGAYCGLGLILIGVSSARSHAPHAAAPHSAASAPPGAPPAPAATGAPPLMQAFLFGLQAGSKADHRTRA